MNLLVQDRFWAQTSAFLQKQLGNEKPLIAPREFRASFPRVFPYEFVMAVESLEGFSAAAVHKGLMHELPYPVMRLLRREWKCVFANEVFVVFMKQASPLQRADANHLAQFDAKLAEIGKIQLAESGSKAWTSLLVVARRSPEALEQTLRSVAPFHWPVAVAVVGEVGRDMSGYKAVLKTCRATLAGVGLHATVADGLNAGISQVLQDSHYTWICCLEDGQLARHDFAIAMEKFRHPAYQPLLSGYWSEEDGILREERRENFRLVRPQRSTSLHRYGHRSYWEKRRELRLPALEPDLLVIPGLVILSEP